MQSSQFILPPPSPNGNGFAGPPAEPSVQAYPDQMALDAQRAEIERIYGTLQLFITPGEIVEIRALGVCTPSCKNAHTEASFFDYQNLPKAAYEAWMLTDYAEGIFFNLNQLNPHLLARQSNHIAPVKAGVVSTDDDIVRRKWLLVDIDPKRPGKVSATDAEKQKARETTIAMRTFLVGRGWPEPIFCDSGNGFHLVFRVDLPADDGALVRRVLHALAAHFDSEVVTVDPAVFNPSRLLKLYGTKSRKGVPTAERPHRWTSILEVPSVLTAVTEQQLLDLAGEHGVRTVASENTVVASPLANRDARLAAALKYFEHLPGAIEGQRGDHHTYMAARDLVIGCELPIDEAYPIFAKWNQERCRPPWEEKDLRRKLIEAAKGNGRRGYLLNVVGSGGRPGAFTGEFVDLTSFMAKERHHEWLVENILVHGQTAVIGGPKKALKSTILLDLAISQSSGSPFLGHFVIHRPRRVLVVSAESGEITIHNSIRRICTAKQLQYQLPLYLNFHMPRLSLENDLDRLGSAIERYGAEVAFLDPLYLGLLAGNANINAGNIYEMGPLILGAAQVCLDRGATPVFVHHCTRSSEAAKKRTGEAMDLEDLSFAGAAEVARQWLILSHREPYDPVTGASRLWLRVGGSAGHAGLFGVDVEEGVMDAECGGRRWRVAVHDAHETLEAKARAKDQERRTAKAAQRQADQEQVIAVLQRSNNPMTAPDITNNIGLSRVRTQAALHALHGSGRVVGAPVDKPCGRNTKPYPGWRLVQAGEGNACVQNAQHLNPGQNDVNAPSPPAAASAATVDCQPSGSQTSGTATQPGPQPITASIGA